MRRTSPTGRRPGVPGFTLLEVMVAITIASMVIVTVYTVFSTVLAASRRVDSHNDRSQSVRGVFLQLEKDLRNIRIPGASDPLVAEGRNLALTTFDESGRKGRAEYALKDGELTRVWHLLEKDAAPGNQIISLCTGLKDWNVKSLDPDDSPLKFPAAIEIDLVWAGTAQAKDAVLTRRVVLEKTAPAPVKDDDADAGGSSH